MLAIPVLALAIPLAAAGAERDDERGRDKFDSEHMFGFTTGSDIGEPRGIEVENETEAGFGKRTGTYAAAVSTFEYKYTVNEHFRYAPSASFSYHNIAGVPDFDPRHQLAFQGLSVELNYRLLNRQTAPFGLTLGLVPRWSLIDEQSGAPVTQYEADMAILMDTELVPGRLYGALNVIYEPAMTRVRGATTWEREATLGFAGALTARVGPALFLGAELRHLRQYDGLGFDDLAGHALFTGPTFYAKLSDHWSVAGAWNVQVAGHAAGDPRALDLVNFDRNVFKLRISAELD